MEHRHDGLIEEGDRTCLRYLRNGGPRISAILNGALLLQLRHECIVNKSGVLRTNIWIIVLIDFIDKLTRVSSEFRKYIFRSVIHKCIEDVQQDQETSGNRHDGGSIVSYERAIAVCLQ